MAAELMVPVAWQRTGDPCFPSAARVGGTWWVLRINSFPDHPLWTLFLGGARVLDVDDAPGPWGNPADPCLPMMGLAEADEAVGPVRSLVAYRSEIGQPCDNPYCCG